jgi:hypothetical protein
MSKGTRLPKSNRLLKNRSDAARATNLECADNGGALNFLDVSHQSRLSEIRHRDYTPRHAKRLLVRISHAS